MDKDIIIKKDGNEWCAHRSDFTNIQESMCGFGSTERKSLDKLRIQEDIQKRELLEKEYKWNE
jgi:hypothetical protein